MNCSEIIFDYPGDADRPPRPLQLWSCVMLRLLDSVRAVGGAIRDRLHLSLLLQRDRGRRHRAEPGSDRRHCVHVHRCLTPRRLVLLERRPHLRRDALWGFDADGGVPFSRRKHGDLIQELIDPRQQVVPVLRLVGNIVENLSDREEACQRT